MGTTFEAVRIQRQYYSSTTTNNNNYNNNYSTREQRWAVGSITTVFLLTFLIITLQLVPQTSRLLHGTKLELLLIILLLGFTCSSVGIATNPSTGMAVNAMGGVSFGNLYYSTWISFTCAMALLLSFIRTERGLDVSSELKSRGKRFRLWVILAVSTLIVMGSSASCYDAKCDYTDQRGFDEPRKYCRRAAFGVSAGCIGCVVSLVIVAIRSVCAKSINDNSGSGKGSANKRIFAMECISSLILLCFYCFAVGYLTSEEGPAAPIGNLFYSTWISFGLIFFIALSCYHEIQMAKKIYRNAQDADMSDGGTNPTWPEYEHTAPMQNHHMPLVDDGKLMSGLSATIGSGSVGEVQVGV